MAAVLCNACGEIASGACDVCGQVCQVPCKACNCLCEGCGTVCETACHSFGQLCASPFSIFVTVAAVFNLPSIYVGLVGIVDEDVTSCAGARWLLVHALLCLANVVAAIYMGVAVVKEVSLTTTEQQQQQQSSPKSAFARAGHLLCYDPIMAIYILVLLGFFAWLWTGAAWSLNGHIHQGCNADGDGIAGKVALALGFGWAFIFFGLAALCLGMCCAYCWDGDANTSSHMQYYDQETPYVPADSAKPGATASVYDNTSKPSSVPTVAASAAPASAKHEPPTAQAVLF